MILVPSSKSIKSYFFANSQCGITLSLLALVLELNITKLSSEEFPAGTHSCGILGIWDKISSISFFTSLKSSERTFEELFISKLLCLRFGISSLLPSLNNCPISLEIVFDSACIFSYSVCINFLLSSKEINLAIKSSELKFLFFRDFITPSLFAIM